MKIQETNIKGSTRYYITLPKTLIKAKQWTKGTELHLAFNERGNIELIDKVTKK
jgi:hypothetical protein